MVEVAEIESASKMVNLSGHSQVYLTYSQVSKVSTISPFLMWPRKSTHPYSRTFTDNDEATIFNLFYFGEINHLS